MLLLKIYADNISAISKKLYIFLISSIFPKNKALNKYPKRCLTLKVLIDFVNPKHNGLSLRIFEALGHNKKLITTNKEVRKYEFYDESNILIYDIHTNTEEIKKFFEKAYIPPVRERLRLDTLLKLDRKYYKSGSSFQKLHFLQQTDNIFCKRNFLKHSYLPLTNLVNLINGIVFNFDSHLLSTKDGNFPSFIIQPIKNLYHFMFRGL